MSPQLATTAIVRRTTTDGAMSLSEEVPLGFVIVVDLATRSKVVESGHSGDFVQRLDGSWCPVELLAINVEGRA